MPPRSAEVGDSVSYPHHGFLSIVARARLLLGGRFNLESITFASAATVRQPAPPPSPQGKRPPGRVRVKPYGGRAGHCLERASWARDPLGPGGGSSRWAEVGGEWAGGLAMGRKMGRGNGCPVLRCGSPVVLSSRSDEMPESYEAIISNLEPGRCSVDPPILQAAAQWPLIDLFAL